MRNMECKMSFAWSAVQFSEAISLNTLYHSLPFLTSSLCLPAVPDIVSSGECSQRELSVWSGPHILPL